MNSNSEVKANPFGTVEQRLQFYFQQCVEHEKIYRKYQRDITFWQGKFAIVKHENNVLRKKLYAKEVTNKPTSDDASSRESERVKQSIERAKRTNTTRG